MESEKQNQPSVTMEDFIIPQKVDAFTQNYKPVDTQTQTCEVFNDARLREFFKAVPIPDLGDPLVDYLEMLEARGFFMRVSLTGEPAIFCELKI